MSTPAQLMDQAKCIDCTIPPGMMLPVLIAQAASALGITDTNQLMDYAKCFDCQIPPGMEMAVLIAQFDSIINL